jgi:AcrR family transcriptional regulator
MYETTVQVPESAADTRERLLNAAGEVFAEQGFKDATVREICRRAGANLASVNYHFGSKERLYRSVVDRASRQLEAQLPPLADQGEPAQRLRGYIGITLHCLLAPGRHTWMARLWAQELMDPSPVMDLVVADLIAPSQLRLRGIIAELTGRGAEDPVVWRLTAFVFGQCLFFHVARPVITRLGRAVPAEDPDIGILADSITRFSLAGILAERAGRP